MADVGEDRVVEIVAAKPFDALRFSENLDLSGVLAQDRGVERVAAKVVHRHRLAVVPGSGRGVARRGCVGFGDHGRLYQARLTSSLFEQCTPEGAPAGRVGQHHVLGGLPWAVVTL